MDEPAVGAAGGLRNLPTLKSLLNLPGRVLQRMREVDRLLDKQSMSYHNTGLAQHSAFNESQIGPSPPASMTAMPGPWGFFGSGYAVVLFAMALLLNRIQHIVVPSRHNPRMSARERQQLSFVKSLWATLFPIDLSSTTARAVLRVPSLYFVIKSLYLWILVLVHATGRFSTAQWPWMQSLEDVASNMEMEELCWTTFLSVCGALAVGALTRGLEGGPTGNTAPFNLFGYAFLLHIYSAPITHTHKKEGLPSRPDVHVLFVMMMPLLQLALLHAMGVKKSWASQRLIPTGLCSLLTLAHFHAVVWSNPARYPLLNYMSCIFESLLIFVTSMTFSLNAFTQLAVEGRVSRYLCGHADTLMPRWDEDFSVVLLRLGTASLEATSVAGLGNEVGGVTAPQYDESRRYGELEMNRNGVTSFTHARDGRRKKDGFMNEVRVVKVGSTEQDSSWGFWPHHRELLRFVEAFWNACRSILLMVWRLVRLRSAFAPRAIHAEHSHLDHEEPRHSVSSRALTPMRDDLDDHDLYRRFLSGETLSDDDDEFKPRFGSVVPEPDGDESDSQEGSDVDEDNEQLAANALSGASASLLLAHMSSPNSALTRRRYSRIQAGEEQAVEPAADPWERFVQEKRRAAQAQPPEGSENRRFCVICTCEERQIICWPCRCLALCDDCRENLASRVSPSKHTCPCCRQPVEGFSRIYIP